MKREIYRQQLLGRSIFLVCTLISLMIACTFSSNPFESSSVEQDTNLQQTIDALSLQATALAQQTTQEVLVQMATKMAEQEAKLSQQVAQYTAIAQEPTSGSIEANVTPTSTSSPETSILLVNFQGKGWNFHRSSSICEKKEIGCWQTTFTEYQVVILSSEEEVMIEPIWENPHLVFRTRYKGMYNLAFGFVELDISGQSAYTRVKSFSGSKDYWHEVTIPLIEFKEKTIKVRFYAEGPSKLWPTDPTYKYTWLIANVQIVPNY